MNFQEPEALLQRMAEVGVVPLDNQAVSNGLARGFESCSLSGNVPGRESLISDDLCSALPDANHAPKSPDMDQSFSFNAKLPGLT